MLRNLIGLRRYCSASLDKVEALVIGGGVVGLAIAKSLSEAGKEVLILENSESFGTQTSSRNSEVIHSGLYYTPGSLRARLCVEGKKRLYKYCAEREIPHKRIGKLLVATNEQQEEHLKQYQKRAPLNGVHDLQWLDGEAIRKLEPHLQCQAALFSPSTGIIDSHQLMLTLLADVEGNGGLLAINSKVVQGDVSGGVKIVEVEDTVNGGKATMEADLVVNAAGLHAQEVATKLRVPQSSVPQRYLAKGNYFSLTGKSPFRHLIYPMPNEAGLGIHLTLDLAGQAKFGPDVEYVDAMDYSVDASRAAGFYAAIRQYWPGLPDDSLQASYCGIRPKLHGPGTQQGDFHIDTSSVPGVVNLYGIESPGLTASMAIGEFVAGHLLQGQA